MQIPGKYADWQQDTKASLTVGNSGIAPPAAVLLFIRRYINKTEPLNNEFHLLKVRFEM